MKINCNQENWWNNKWASVELGQKSWSIKGPKSHTRYNKRKQRIQYDKESRSAWNGPNSAKKYKANPRETVNTLEQYTSPTDIWHMGRACNVWASYSLQKGLQELHETFFKRHEQREVQSNLQDIPIHWREGVAARDFETVRSKMFNLCSIRSDKIAKLKTKTTQKTKICGYSLWQWWKFKVHQNV